MIKSKYIAKILAKLRIPSFDKCELDKTCNVNYRINLILRKNLFNGISVTYIGLIERNFSACQLFNSFNRYGTAV